MKVWMPGEIPPRVASGQVRTYGDEDHVVISDDETWARVCVTVDPDDPAEEFPIGAVAKWPLSEPWADPATKESQ